MLQEMPCWSTPDPTFGCQTYSKLVFGIQAQAEFDDSNTFMLGSDECCVDSALSELPLALTMCM